MCYCYLFEKLERRKESVTRAPEPCRARRVTRIVAWKNHVTCELRRGRVRVHEEITTSLLLYRVNVLPFLRIESTQLKRCIKYRRY
jgi:hypothetical protein